MPKLSEIDAADIEEVKPGALKLSDIPADSIEEVAVSPASPQPQSQASPAMSKTEARLRGAAQGATANFGDELTSGIDAALETGRDFLGGGSTLAPGEGPIAKYGAALESNRNQNKQAEKVSPTGYLLSQIGGSIPINVALGGGGLARQVATNAGIAGLESIGASEDKTSLAAAKKSATSGGIAGAVTLALGLTGKLLTAARKGLLDVPANAFKLGAQSGKALSEDPVARAVASDVIKTGEELGSQVQQAKQEIGPKLSEVADYLTNKSVNPPVIDLETKLNGPIQKLASFKPARDAEAVAVKDELLDVLKGIGKDVGESGDLKNASFQAVHKVREELGQKIWDQKLFDKNDYVRKQAINLYRDLAGSLKEADTSGQYKDFSDLYSALSESDPESFRSSILDYLNDPSNLSAGERFRKVIGSIEELPDALKQQYMPTLNSFIKNDLKDAAVKREVLKATNGKFSLFSGKIAIPGASTIANELGAEYGQSPQLLQKGMSLLSRGVGSVTPTLGAIGQGAVRAGTEKAASSIADRIISRR